MLFCAFFLCWACAFVLLLHLIYFFLCVDILTKTPPASFGIFSAFFDTVSKIFIYPNNIFYIDKNGLGRFLLFGLFRLGD